MQELFRLVPDVEELVMMEPEELAKLLLKALHSRASLNRQSHLHSSNLAGELCAAGCYPLERQEDILRAFVEAWSFLRNEGLLVSVGGSNASSGWERLSRRAERLAKLDDQREFRASFQFPRHLIHPRIVDAVWPQFLRGQYSAAVFQAMREVEIYTREAGRFAPEDLGVKLMRKAFDKEHGPLRDPALPDPEREALANLVAGTIGVYKNPHSHRHVDLTDPVEAVEMIMLASHILRIIDARKDG